jgi:hypothetical protein
MSEFDPSKVDHPKFIDRVATLECALADVAKESRDRYERLESEKLEVENQIRIAEKTIADRDRTIAILEENLERAESNHLEQLRAIAQMLEPLATHEDKGSLYLSHFGKAAMIYMIQKVIYANIEKLDPTPCTYFDGF